MKNKKPLINLFNRKTNLHSDKKNNLSHLKKFLPRQITQSQPAITSRRTRQQRNDNRKLTRTHISRDHFLNIPRPRRIKQKIPTRTEINRRFGTSTRIHKIIRLQLRPVHIRLRSRPINFRMIPQKPL